MFNILKINCDVKKNYFKLDTEIYFSALNYGVNLDAELGILIYIDISFIFTIIQTLIFIIITFVCTFFLFDYSFININA